MLVLSRQRDESIIIGDNIVIEDMRAAGIDPTTAKSLVQFPNRRNCCRH